MKNFIFLFLVMAMLFPDIGYGEALFEDVHAVAMPKKFSYRGMPGDIIELKDGSLLMSYTIDGKGGGIAAKKSVDKGKTWGQQFMLVPHKESSAPQGWYAHPSFLRLPNDDIFLAYVYSAETKPYYVHNYYRRSKDDGKTWSHQYILTPYLGQVAMHNDKFCLLSSGRILAPVEYKRKRPSSADHSDFAAATFYSDTNGHSWFMSNEINVLPIEAQEPHVVELKDGRVLLVFRTYSGFIGRAYSSDGGKTWSKGELLKDVKMSKNASAISVDRIPSTGDLLMIRATGRGCENKRCRTPLVSAISKDEGQSWIYEKVMFGGDEDYGYQSVTFVDDLALMSYHRTDGLHVARISIDWFYE